MRPCQGMVGLFQWISLPKLKESYGTTLANELAEFHERNLCCIGWGLAESHERNLCCIGLGGVF